MIVGENSRSGDMDVNPTKEKKLTNIRTHSPRRVVAADPPRPITLESALEFISGDELVEVETGYEAVTRLCAPME